MNPAWVKAACAGRQMVSSVPHSGVRLSNRPWQPVSCRVSMVKARVRGPERSSAWAMPRACPWWSPVGEQGVKGPKSPGGGAVRQGQGGQQGHQGGLGVVPLFRRGAVGVLPAAEDVDPWSLLLTGERDGLLQRQVPDGGFHGVQRQTQNRGLGLGRDHIQPGAAGEVRDPGQSLLLGPGSLKGGLIVPFFNVDDGKSASGEMV